jgi:hypothetical protein
MLMREVRHIWAGAALLLLALSAHVQSQEKNGAEVVNASDLAEAVRIHVASVSTRTPGGAYPLFHGGKKLELTLVEINEERLTNLGRAFYVICADFKGAEGNSYDVDFYVSGSPGKMAVSQVEIHRINDRPLYEWAQRPDGSWGKAAAE